jgi:NTP pyrophosphatase (non-canonical NTP hydrolase)
MTPEFPRDRFTDEYGISLHHARQLSQLDSELGAHWRKVVASFSEGQLAPQERVKQFMDARPIMRDNDSIPHVAGKLKEEVDEMLEAFTWEGREPTDEELRNFRQELADLVIYSYVLANLVGVEMNQAVVDKIEVNERRFPAHLFQEGDFTTIYMARKIELGERTADNGRQEQEGAARENPGEPISSTGGKEENQNFYPVAVEEK